MRVFADRSICFADTAARLIALALLKTPMELASVGHANVNILTTKNVRPPFGKRDAAVASLYFYDDDCSTATNAQASREKDAGSRHRTTQLSRC